MSPVRAAFLAALCGVALAATQPPVSFPWTIFLALPPLLWLCEAAARPRAAFLRGWAAGAGYFGAGLFWIVEPFLVEPERYGALAPFALLGMAGGLALFWGAAFAVARRIGRQGLAGALVLACLWTFAEWLRGHVLTGFPWALPGYAWIETPVMQVASVVGPYGLTLLTLTAGLLPGAAPGRRGLAAGATAALALAAAGWSYGAWRLALPEPERAPPLVARLVQPNIPQRLKWRPELQQEFFERHLAATRDTAEPAPDVTIWPETAAPFLLGEAPWLQAEIAAAAGGRPVILGINRAQPAADGELWFNSLAVLGEDGGALAVYDKTRLVPFGEYIPLGGLIGRLGGPEIATLTVRGFSPGPGPHLVTAAGLPPFLPLVCYEAIFPAALRAPEGRPEWVVQVTNDAWFGALAGPYQHFAQARARAIEQGLPIARAANTGVSAMIDSRGRVVAMLPLGVEGYIDAPLPAAWPETMYARWGDVPVLLALVAVFGLTASNLMSRVSRSPRR
ncbi:MAG: apolipoprotein N-acyltransferase [Amaricoccus sp.]|nr:apolipoprotein N-acyltransferase [Amaricoccus sp.]